MNLFFLFDSGKGHKGFLMGFFMSAGLVNQPATKWSKL